MNKNKDKDDPLILNNETVNDRGWKCEYFFAEKSTLGDDVEHLLEKWNTEGIRILCVPSQFFDVNYIS